MLSYCGSCFTQGAIHFAADRACLVAVSDFERDQDDAQWPMRFAAQGNLVHKQQLIQTEQRLNVERPTI
jgi:hypothetical protein